MTDIKTSVCLPDWNKKRGLMQMTYVVSHWVSLQNEDENTASRYSYLLIGKRLEDQRKSG
jgi:hypothetical protein